MERHSVLVLEPHSTCVGAEDWWRGRSDCPGMQYAELYSEHRLLVDRFEDYPDGGRVRRAVQRQLHVTRLEPRGGNADQHL